MTEVYMGQIMMTGFPFAQKNFAQCNGQAIGISQNQALFSLLGVAYGGDGVRTFNLPNLQGRTPTGGGRSYAYGAINGVEAVTLVQNEMPMHNHTFNAIARDSTAPAVSNAMFAGAKNGQASVAAYAVPSGSDYVPLNANTLNPVGGNQSHPNLQPFTVINFNIAMFGVFPSRN